jgi:hypothetical protein
LTGFAQYLNPSSSPESFAQHSAAAAHSIATNNSNVFIVSFIVSPGVRSRGMR